MGKCQKRSGTIFYRFDDILSAYSSVKNGRFLYLSSENVFGKSYPEDVQETESVSANSFHALAVAQGEETCKNYYSTRGMESIVVRIDHLYGTPVKGKMQTDPCFQMTLEMLKSGKIAANGRNLFSMIHKMMLSNLFTASQWLTI